MQRQRMWVNTLHTYQYHANEGNVLTPIIIFFLVPHISTVAAITAVAPLAAIAPVTADWERWGTTPGTSINYQMSFMRQQQPSIGEILDSGDWTNDVSGAGGNSKLGIYCFVAWPHCWPGFKVEPVLRRRFGLVGSQQPTH